MVKGAASVLYPSPHERFGFAYTGTGGSGGLETYDVEQLHAGWYLNWTVDRDPSRVGGLEYAQMIRLHQMTECWPERIRDRDLCPYTEPYTYILRSPNSRAYVVSTAQANPGSLWLIGNEMDRYDWGIRDPGNPGEYVVAPGGQDEMLPQVYAQAYHEFYHLIKGADPTARIAIGGVVQPTPIRRLYLDKVLDSYQDRYGEPMPVDVWNIHNMILREEVGSWGADVPPGIDAEEGSLYTVQDHDDIDVFERHIVEFRQWMEEKGQREKPLIVSEYGILMPRDYGFECPTVTTFMTATFDYMMTATDDALGYPADENRLVQRWVWYSLDDHEFEGESSCSHLFDPQQEVITYTGHVFADYILQNDLIVPYRDLRPVTLTLSTSDQSVPLYGQPTTLTLASRVVNWGNDSTLSFTVSFSHAMSLLETFSVPGLAPRYDGEVVLDTEWTGPVTGPAIFRVHADSTDRVDEGREDNNVLTATLDVDLAVEDVTSSPPLVEPGHTVDVEVTARLSNHGDVTVRDVACQLRDVGGDETITTTTVAELAPGSVEDVSFTWPQRPVGRYLAEVVVDPEELVTESDEENNRTRRNILVASCRVFLPVVASSKSPTLARDPARSSLPHLFAVDKRTRYAKRAVSAIGGRRRDEANHL